MVQRCDGQFQWLKMQEDALKSWMNLKHLQRKIESTPTGLHEIYDKSWRRIQRSTRKKRAFFILRWAACSVRPLSVAEAAEAALIDEQEGDLSMEDMPEELNADYVESEIQELCSPLLKIRRPDSHISAARWTIHLSHFTVREYLVQQLPVTELESNMELQNSYEQMQHNILARFCLNYIRSVQVWEVASDQSSPPFREYAASAWYVHVNKSMFDNHDAKTIKLALGFMTASHPCWVHWREWFDKYKEDSPEKRGESDTMPPDPLYYALKLHVRSVVSEKVQAMRYIPQQSSPGRSAFHAACSLGDVSTIKTFLDAGTDVHLRGWNGRTPIFTAAISGQTELIRTLLDSGGDVNITKDDGIAPLHTAIDNGHFETAKLLLDENASLDSRNPRGWVPIHMAAWRGRLAMLELMLNKGGMRYINTQTHRGLTPVHMSVVTEHLNVVKCLVKRGADIHLADKAGWRPVHAAAGRGHVEILQTLLDEGADINTPVCPANLQEGFFGWTAIHLAAYYHRSNILRQLLSSGTFDGADLEATTASRDETPLHLAATSGHAFAVQLFLTKPTISVNAQDMSGHTALFLATQQGHAPVIEVLLGDNRVDINTANYYGNTALDVAVRNGHSGIVKLLLAATPLSPNSENKLRGKDLLQWATHSGNHDTIHLLNQSIHRIHAKTPEGELEYSFTEGIVVAFSRQRAWCYACTVCLPKNTAELGLRCVWCDGGYLYLCTSCVSRGTKCHDTKHTLVKLEEKDIQGRHEYINHAYNLSWNT